MKHKLAARALALALTALASQAHAANRVVRVTNRSAQPVTSLFGSNVGTNSWEEDLLRMEVLLSGESALIDFDDGTGHCLFDFMAVFADGHRAVAGSINVCAEAQVDIYD